MRTVKIRNRLCEEKINTKLDKLLELALSKEVSISSETKNVDTLGKNVCGKSHTGTELCKYSNYKCNTR